MSRPGAAWSWIGKRTASVWAKRKNYSDATCRSSLHIGRRLRKSPNTRSKPVSLPRRQADFVDTKKNSSRLNGNACARCRPASSLLSPRRHEARGYMPSVLTATERRRHNKTPRSALACSRDELFEAAMGFVVGHLLGRMLAEIGGGGMKNAAVASVERELRAPDRVNRDAG